MKLLTCSDSCNKCRLGVLYTAVCRNSKAFVEKTRTGGEIKREFFIVCISLNKKKIHVPFYLYLPSATVPKALHDRVYLLLEHLGQFGAVLVHA